MGEVKIFYFTGSRPRSFQEEKVKGKEGAGIRNCRRQEANVKANVNFDGVSKVGDDFMFLCLFEL